MRCAGQYISIPLHLNLKMIYYIYATQKKISYFKKPVVKMLITISILLN